VGDELAKAISTMHGPVLQEDILAQGKIRIQYRGSPDRKDFEEARAHFAAKAKPGGSHQTESGRLICSMTKTWIWLDVAMRHCY
jgi:hypothetical protein